jgi:hypothetical protein
MRSWIGSVTRVRPGSPSGTVLVLTEMLYISVSNVVSSTVLVKPVSSLPWPMASESRERHDDRRKSASHRCGRDPEVCGH